MIGRSHGSVPEWDIQSRPQIRLTTDAGPEVSLPVVDRALRGEGLKIVEQRPDGLVAQHRDWAALVMEVNLAFRTHLRVDAEGRTLVATVGFNDDGRPARKKIAAALSHAVDELRAQGHQVDVGAWQSQSKEDRQQRD